MKRRTFIAGLGSTAAWPVAGRAQQSGGVRRVGVLMDRIATDAQAQANLATFVQGLRQSGWAEGQNLRIDVRWTAGDAGLARIYAAQLIGLMPDVILASTTINLTEIQQATSTVPVVFVSVSDPVAQGFVASMRHPGGNLTGFSIYEFSMGGKWLGLLKEVAPGLARVAVMFNPDTSPQSKFFMQAIGVAAACLGVQVIAAPVRATAEIEPALESFGRQPNGGLILTTRELIPNATRVGVLADPGFPGIQSIIIDLQSAGRILGLQLVIASARTESDLETAFATFSQQRVDAVLVSNGGFFSRRMEQLAALAARHGLPAIFQYREFALAGGTMSYGSSLGYLYHQAGTYTGRILKGEKPAELPVVQPTKFELAINLKTAKALGLTIPETLLATADEVIQ